MTGVSVHRVTLATGQVLTFAAVSNKLKVTLSNGSTVWLMLQES